MRRSAWSFRAPCGTGGGTRRPRSWAFVHALALLAGALPAGAGTIRHDRDPNLYLNLASDPNYVSVGYLTTGGADASGTLIASNYVLTAAHLVNAGSPYTFRLGSTVYQGAWGQLEPNWKDANCVDYDIGIVRLKTLVFNVAPAVLYTDTSELGKQGTVVGYGCTGTGLTGYVRGTDGTKRAGYNMIDRTGLGFYGHTTRMLLADFDDPNDPNDSYSGTSTPLNLEYLSALYDSGGGVFITVGGQQKLAGVISGVWGVRDGLSDSDYGDVMGMTRVSSYAAWINRVMGTHYVMKWTASGSGGLNTAENWQTTRNSITWNVVPGPADVAVFDANASYTVTWPDGNVTNDRLRVNRGSVTFDLRTTTYTVKNDPNYEPSVIVGELGLPATLLVTNGLLASGNAYIGPNTADVATVIVVGGGRWNSTGAIHVGGGASGSGGAGLLRIDPNGTVSAAGQVKVWSAGTVHLNGGSLSAGQIALSGGTLRGWGQVWSPVSASGGTVDANGGAIDLSGQLSIAAGTTLTKAGPGTLVVRGSQAHGAGSRITAIAGVVEFLTDAGGEANSPSRNLTVTADGGQVVFRATQHLAGLEVLTGGATIAAGGGRVVATGSLSIDANDSRLDVRDNDLILDYDANAPSPVEQVRQWIVAGHNGGAWNGNGITSSYITDPDPNGDPNQAGDQFTRALGYAQNDDEHMLFGRFYEFDGVEVDDTCVIVKYTRLGDLNLDGMVTDMDVTILGLNYDYDPETGDHPRGPIWHWWDGDLNYDGYIDDVDVTLLGINYDTIGVPLATEFFAAVMPEPGTAVLLALGAGAVLTRRRAGGIGSRTARG